MSQLFDYFVCSRPLIDKWADALLNEDEEMRAQLEAEMPRMVTLKNLGPDHFNFLAGCGEGATLDLVEAVGAVDLVNAVSEQDGPWVLAFRKPAIDAIAAMDMSEAELARWAQAIAEFSGQDVEWVRTGVSADAAKTIQELCSCAVDNQLGIFACFYG